MRAVAAALTLFAVLGCDGSEAPLPTEASITADRCLVRLHGKGGTGTAPVVLEDGTAVVSPSGNGTGWGGREWRYFPRDRFDEARLRVATAAAGCEQIILNGFSNGGAFAAKLYCSGEDFDGKLTRVVIDDPVTDHAVDNCRPASEVEAILYWTGALQPPSQPGTDCSKMDWTCEAGETIGIEAFSGALGVDWKQSSHREHIWFTEAPEVRDW